VAMTTEVRPTGPRLDEDELSTWRAFLRAHSTMLRRISRDLEEAEMPPLTWYDVLATLRDAPEHRLRQVEIADRVLLSNSGLSRLIDRIEEKGLVKRVRCPTDRRALNVELTEEGTAMLERMWPVYARGIADDFLPALGASFNEIRATMEAIGRQCDAAREAEAVTAAAANGFRDGAGSA
jgi:DNA-binding MarR family transcriptional regulator